MTNTEYLAPIDTHHPDFASFYDELPLWSAPFVRLLLDHVPLGPDLRILDVGAGTGFLTVELAQRCGPGSSVIAVDPWAPGMARLKARLAYLDLHNVQLLVEDMAEVSQPSGSIDVALSNLGINNFERPEAVLQSCHRALVDRGTLLLTTNLVGHMAELYDCYRTVTESSDLPGLDKTAVLAALDRHIEHRGTLDSVAALLRSSGYDSIESHCDSFRLRFADGSALLRHYFIRLGFLPAWKTLLPDSLVEPFFERLEAELNRVARTRGGLALSVPMALFQARRAEQASRS